MLHLLSSSLSLLLMVLLTLLTLLRLLCLLLYPGERGDRCVRIYEPLALGSVEAPGRHRSFLLDQLRRGGCLGSLLAKFLCDFAGLRRFDAT